MSDQKDPGPYTATTLAQAAGVGFGYVARLCRAGKLPCRKLGTVWMIARDDGQTWLTGRQKPEAR